MTPQAIVYDAHDHAHAHYLSSVATIHADCITQDGTTATFMPPISHTKILDWWVKVAEETVGESPQRIIVLGLLPRNAPPASDSLAAAGKEGLEIAGVVMLHIPTTETNTFRGEVQKFLVSPRCREMGVGKVLMRKLEQVARERNMSLTAVERQDPGPKPNQLGCCFPTLDSKLEKKKDEIACADDVKSKVLETETGSPAELVYEKFGYIKYGVVPSYELAPDGIAKDNSFFYKDLNKSLPI